MPLSGTVTAGSAALASQYNNLRSDVVSTTQGHTHTGASENGAQVEGTALKSTGATAGYVLTAGAGGTATTWAAPASSGALTAISGTAAFSTATAGTGIFTSVTGANGRWYATTSSGTTVVAVRNTEATSQLIHIFNINNGVAAASTTISPATAGTTDFYPGGYGFNAGTAFALLETGKTGSVQTVTLRKLNTALTSVMWSTQLFTGSYSGASFFNVGPFMSSSSQNIRYASGPGIWYGGDKRTYQHAAGTSQIAKVWVVNDTSGSAYSATFGSATGTTVADTQDSLTSGLLFVPSISDATSGTIHAWGFNGGTPRYCKYSVGSASITALSTADGVYGGTVSGQYEFPAPFYQGVPSQTAFWLSSDNKILLQSSSALQVWDRTLTTLEYSSPIAPGVTNLFNTYSLESSFDPVSMRSHNGTTWYQLGRVDGNIAPQGSAFNVTANTWNSYYGVLAGAGSATVQFNDVYISAAGTVMQMPMAGIAKVPFGGTSSSRREMTISPSSLEKVIAIDSGGGYAQSAAFGTSLVRNGAYTFIAGTAQVYVYVRHTLTDNNASSFKSVQGDLIMGGSAVVDGYQLTLA